MEHPVTRLNRRLNHYPIIIEPPTDNAEEHLLQLVADAKAAIETLFHIKKIVETNMSFAIRTAEITDYTKLPDPKAEFARQFPPTDKGKIEALTIILSKIKFD